MNDLWPIRSMPIRTCALLIVLSFAGTGCQAPNPATGSRTPALTPSAIPLYVESEYSETPGRVMPVLSGRRIIDAFDFPFAIDRGTRYQRLRSEYIEVGTFERAGDDPETPEVSGVYYISVFFGPDAGFDATPDVVAVTQRHYLEWLMEGALFRRRVGIHSPSAMEGHDHRDDSGCWTRFALRDVAEPDGYGLYMINLRLGEGAAGTFDSHLTLQVETTGSRTANAVLREVLETFRPYIVCTGEAAA